MISALEIKTAASIFISLLLIYFLFIFQPSSQNIYTHSKALGLLNAVGMIQVNKCSEQQKIANCSGTLLDGIHEEAIDGENGIITLAKDSECPIKIVGGTEIHYSAAVGGDDADEKCQNGWKLQIEKNECIDGYIMNVFQKMGSAGKWRAASGNIYSDIENGWEIQYLPACLLDSMISQQPSNNLAENALSTISKINETESAEICSNFGGVCLHNTNKSELNWCKFGRQRCEERDKKCCLPDKIAYRSPCELKGGECMLTNLCNQKTAKIETKICAQSDRDVICCIPNQKKNATSGNVLWIFILVGVMLIIVLAIISTLLLFFYWKWQIGKKSVKNSLNSGGTFETTIEGTMPTTTAIESNLAVEFDREARSKMESVSILNDILMYQEVGKKWSEIQRNSARLTIKGRIYADFVPADEFKIMRELGAGNYSKVYMYKFRGMEIAVKRIRLMAGSEDLKRAFVDLSVLENAKCPYITTYFGYFLDQNFIYICMEPMATCFWRILEIDLKREHGIPEAAVGKVILSVVKALEYLRSKHEIIHRDVKPSNILLGQDGIKLCDFGIAGRLIESKAITTTLGCLAYMAPERLNAEKIYDIRADVWSVGVTGIELLTAKHPFEAADEIELLVKITDCAPQIRSNSNEPLSAEFAAFSRSCLQKEFNKRPNYKQLLKSPFLKMHEKIPTDVWAWYKRKFAK